MAVDNEFEIKDIPLVKDFLGEKNRIEKLMHQSVQRKIPVIAMETAAVLEAICFAYRPVNIIEIGCGTGFSTYFIVKHFLQIAKENPPQYLPDLKSGILKYTGIDLNSQRLSEARDYIKDLFSPGTKENVKDCIVIDFICGNAINIIPELKGGFDMVFIDAAKMEYPDYLAALLQKMAEGCIVIADNIFYSSKVFNDLISEHDKNSVSGIRRYIKKITDDNYFSTVFINAGDGIALSVYKKNP